MLLQERKQSLALSLKSPPFTPHPLIADFERKKVRDFERF
jgi:hypothetical protein